MGGKKVVTSVRPIVEKVVSDLGYELVDVEYKKNYDGMALNVIIYSEAGITLDDCEKVSKALDAPLDELNPTNDEPYSLNVSSPGLDKPIKTYDDFRRNLNKEISVKLFSPLNGKKEYVGILTEQTETEFTIVQENNEKITFEKSKTAHIVPVIKF